MTYPETKPIADSFIGLCAPVPEAREALHFAQFYDDDSFLCRAVARFVGAGLAGGDAVILLATEAHRDAVLRQLSATVIDAGRARSRGELTLLDAAEALDGILVDGALDVRLFRRFVDRVLAEAHEARPRARIYGELVDLLWQRGDSETALHLDELWCELSDKHMFSSLMCAYSMDHFDNDEFERVGRAHSHVLPAEGFGDLSFAQSPESRFQEAARLAQSERALTAENARLVHSARRAERVVMEEKSKLRRLFMQVPLPIAIYRGRDHVCEFLNKKGKKLFGADALGKAVGASQVPTLYGTTLEDVFGKGESFVAPEISFDDDDRRRVYQFVYEPYRDAEGHVEGVMSFGFDVTTQVEARRAVETASRLKDEFLTTVSHELRTPLNAILGWVQLLKAGHVPEDRRRRALETIERNAQVQSQLIGDLLDVSKIISGKLRLHIDLVNINQVIGEAIASVEPAAAAKVIELTKDIDETVGPFLGDADRLQQVVWNLVSNAVKFTEHGGHVSIRAQKKSGQLEISVKDDGHGIETEFLPYVFERFRQADGATTRSFGGLGIGLAIVRHLIELHGGRVCVASEGPGRGATFVVCVPMARINLE